MEKTDIMKKEELLSIENLSIRFRQYESGGGRRAFRQTFLPVITGLNVTVHRGEIVAVVGASGSGKSLLAHAVLGLLPSNAFLEGSIRYRGKETGESDGVPGIALVPQSVAWLDPLMKIGKQVLAGRKDSCGKGAACGRCLPGMGFRRTVEELYPYACSGGMIRRILLATALMDEPRRLLRTSRRREWN